MGTVRAVVDRLPASSRLRQRVLPRFKTEETKTQGATKGAAHATEALMSKRMTKMEACHFLTMLRDEIDAELTRLREREKKNAPVSGGTPSAQVDGSAIDRSVCHNAECHAPKRNCCAAYLGCEGFETLVHVRPNAGDMDPETDIRMWTRSRIMDHENKIRALEMAGAGLTR
jgi:hypothetical protein